MEHRCSSQLWPAPRWMLLRIGLASRPLLIDWPRSGRLTRVCRHRVRINDVVDIGGLVEETGCAQAHDLGWSSRFDSGFGSIEGLEGVAATVRLHRASGTVIRTRTSHGKEYGSCRSCL